MKTHEIYFRDLQPELQNELAKEHGYKSIEDYEAETNSSVVPFGELIIYDKGEEPPEDEA